MPSRLSLCSEDRRRQRTTAFVAGNGRAVSAKQGVPVVVRMPPDLHEAVKAKAASEERSMAQAIRWALRCYVQNDWAAR